MSTRTKGEGSISPTLRLNFEGRANTPKIDNVNHVIG